MVGVARPWTKWAVEVNRVQDLPSAIRRAMQSGAHAADRSGVPLAPDRRADGNRRARPHAGQAARSSHPAARRGAAAGRSNVGTGNNPAILVGSRVVEADAVGELVAVAERLGAPVISESGTTHGRLSFPPIIRFMARVFRSGRPRCASGWTSSTCLLVVGMDLLRQYVYHEPSRAIPEHIRLVHLDDDPWQTRQELPGRSGRGRRPEVGAGRVGRSSMGTLDVRSSAKPRQPALPVGRRVHADERGEGAKPRRPRCAIRATHDAVGLMASLARVLPPRRGRVEEAVTTTNTTFERLGVLKNTNGYFGHRGWALGWGLGCAIGVKLAWPDRPVLALLGEGAAMYGIQGLWTAARYRLPVTFVICNNAQYQILESPARISWGLPAARSGQFVGIDLVEPEMDFVALAKSLGVEAVAGHRTGRTGRSGASIAAE